MNTSRQLFRVVNHVKLPSHINTSSQMIESEQKTLMSFCWPDGSPCIPVESFLLEKSYDVSVRSHDGGTLKVFASHLTHLTRFCFEQAIQFWDLDDDSFKQFVVRYLPEKRYSTHKFMTRKNNTIRAIVRSCITFLEWLQTSMGTDRLIVGPRELYPQIRLVSKTVHKSKYESHLILRYQYSPQPDTPEPKGPMPDFIRNALWDAVTTNEQSTIETNYLSARREQLLSLLEATGCRPGELAMLDASINKQPTKENALYMVTEKRRRTKDPTRKIPISLETSISLERFLQVEHKALIDDLKTRNFNPSEKFVFLSSKTGMPMSPGSLTKDFDRIVERAKINQRACMSMFRHRFITIQVALHLQDHINGRNAFTADQILIIDKISILTRVATITGHSHPESLLPYIDLAWDYLGIFKPIDRAREIARILNESAVHIRTIGKKLVDKQNLTKLQIINSISEEIELIENRIRILIDPSSSG